MKTPKVFGIGFHKTGTKSLAGALTILGYRVTGPNLVSEPNLSERIHGLAMELAAQYDAFQDNPWPLLYREMDQRFPGSRFVLTLRDPRDWIRSVAGHFGERTTPMRKWIYGHDKGSPIGNEAHYLARYERHNREVLEYFRDRPGDLLVLRLVEGEGWEKLCPFLGAPTPRVSFPYRNHSRRRVLVNRLRQRLFGWAGARQR